MVSEYSDYEDGKGGYKLKTSFTHGKMYPDFESASIKTITGIQCRLEGPDYILRAIYKQAKGLEGMSYSSGSYNVHSILFDSVDVMMPFLRSLNGKTIRELANPVEISYMPGEEQLDSSKRVTFETPMAQMAIEARKCVAQNKKGVA